MATQVDQAPVIHSDAENTALRERSGRVEIRGDRLISFLYDLMRDHLPPGVVEKLVRDAEPDVTYSNGWLAWYAKDLADRLNPPGRIPLQLEQYVVVAPAGPGPELDVKGTFRKRCL